MQTREEIKVTIRIRKTLHASTMNTTKAAIRCDTHHGVVNVCSCFHPSGSSLKIFRAYNFVTDSLLHRR